MRGQASIRGVNQKRIRLTSFHQSIHTDMGECQSVREARSTRRTKEERPLQTTTGSAVGSGRWKEERIRTMVARGTQGVDGWQGFAHVRALRGYYYNYNSARHAARAEQTLTGRRSARRRERLRAERMKRHRRMTGQSRGPGRSIQDEHHLRLMFTDVHMVTPAPSSAAVALPTNRRFRRQARRQPTPFVRAGDRRGPCARCCSRSQQRRRRRGGCSRR